MQKVEDQGYANPQVPRIQDMTQPMGPLDEGDQALADVAGGIPSGEHSAEYDGGTVRVSKQRGAAEDVIVATTAKPDGSTEYASTVINRAPKGAVIVARKREWPLGSFGDSQRNTQALGNEVWTGNNPFNREPDRQVAQALKLEVAERI